MSLITPLIKMTAVIGILFVITSACQKSVPAFQLKTTPHFYADSSLLRDTTQITPGKDSTTTKDSTLKKDSIVTKDSTVIKKDSTIIKKDSVVIVTPPPVTPPPTPPVVVPPVVVPPPTPPAPTQNVINVGTGSGDLTIDGTGKTYACNSIIKVKAGRYSTISVKNINAANGCPVYIKNDGLVEITGGQSQYSNLNNVIISGDGTSGISKGFAFHDLSYRAVNISGEVNNFTLQYVSFKNINDYTISFGNVRTYTGSANSYSQNLKFLNIDCENNNLLQASGTMTTGLIKNIEIAYCNFKNAPDVGTIAYMGNAENFDIHNNRIDNINANNNNHNGIFMIQGNGKFHDNYVSNHEGNSIRVWAFTLGSTPKDILIYNNIVVNSRKYSGFEVQSFANFILPGVTTYANAKVFNNTCGNLDLSHGWVGGVVDVYNLFGGSCEVFNNLGYNLFPAGTIANQQSILTPNAHDNLYFATSSAAGLVDEINFKLQSNSPAKGTGKTTSLLTTDYYGTSRGGSPSIGAVQ